MAEQSTTGSALYSVGTGVIGDISAEARKNAMDRIKADGVERKRKQQETEKKSDQAFAELSKLKTGGPRAYGEYLKEKRDGIGNWLTEGFQKSDGNFFSGPEGRKNRVEFNNRIAEFNNTLAYTEQTQVELEKQQALLAQDPESYTDESVEANKNYMSLSLDERLKADVPKLQLKVDPVDWEANLVGGLKPNTFVEKDYYAGKSGSGGNYKLKEDDLDAHVDRVVGVTFTEGAGNKYTDGFKKSITALYDNDPEIRALAPSRVLDETGSSPYLEGLKEFAKKQLKDKIVATQSSGEISRSYRDPKGGETDEDYVAPTRGGGGTQRFSIYKEGGKSKRDADLNYTESANINFDTGTDGLGALDASVVFEEDGRIRTRKGNTILPKAGGVVMYGIPLTDFSKGKQKMMKDAGITGPTVDVLRISETQEEVLDKKDKVIKEGGEKSTLIPITPSVRNSLQATSSRFKSLEKAPAEGFDPNDY